MDKELKISISVNGQTQELDLTKKKLDSVSSSADDFNTRLKDMAHTVSAMYAVREAYASIGSAIQKSMNFNDKFAELTTLTNKSGAEYDALKQHILNLNSSASKLDITEALYQAQSAGIDFDKSLTFVLTSQKLAKAGATDLATSTNVLTSMLNAYGLGADKADEFSQILFATVKNGKVRIADLASSLGQVAPLAAQAGVSFMELNASMAVVTNNGISAAEATTGIRAIIASILKPTDEAKQSAKQLGIEWDLAGLKAKGLGGLVGELNAKTGGNAEAMMKVVPQIEAMSALMSIGADNASKLTNVMGAMSSKAGDFEEAVKKMATQKSKVAELGNEWDALMVKIGDSAGGEGAIKLASGAIHFVSNNLIDLEKGLKGVATFGVAFGSVLAAQKIYAFATAVDVATVSTGRLGTAMKFVAANPIGLALSALISLGVIVKDTLNEADAHLKKTKEDYAEFVKTRDANPPAISKKEQLQAGIDSYVNAYTHAVETGNKASAETALKMIKDFNNKIIALDKPTQKSGSGGNLQSQKGIDEAKARAEFLTGIEADTRIALLSGADKQYAELDKKYNEDLAKYKLTGDDKTKLDKWKAAESKKIEDADQAEKDKYLAEQLQKSQDYYNDQTKQELAYYEITKQNEKALEIKQAEWAKEFALLSEDDRQKAIAAKMDEYKKQHEQPQKLEWIITAEMKIDVLAEINKMVGSIDWSDGAKTLQNVAKQGMSTASDVLMQGDATMKAVGIGLKIFGSYMESVVADNEARAQSVIALQNLNATQTIANGEALKKWNDELESSRQKLADDEMNKYKYEYSIVQELKSISQTLADLKGQGDTTIEDIKLASMSSFQKKDYYKAQYDTAVTDYNNALSSGTDEQITAGYQKILSLGKTIAGLSNMDDDSTILSDIQKAKDKLKLWNASDYLNAYALSNAGDTNNIAFADSSASAQTVLNEFLNSSDKSGYIKAMLGTADGATKAQDFSEYLTALGKYSENQTAFTSAIAAYNTSLQATVGQAIEGSFGAWSNVGYGAISSSVGNSWSNTARDGYYFNVNGQVFKTLDATAEKGWLGNIDHMDYRGIKADGTSFNISKDDLKNIAVASQNTIQASDIKTISTNSYDTNALLAQVVALLQANNNLQTRALNK